MSFGDKQVSERIGRLFTDEQIAGRFNGSALVAREGQVLWEGGCGYADYVHAIPNDATTVFKIGSMTKAFVSLAVLQTAERGLLKTSDTIDSYLPGFPQGDRVTIYQLMTHTSGVWCYLQSANSPLQHSMSVPHTPEWLVECIWGRPFDFVPGTRWKYSNSGYVLLGLIIEKVTGLPLGELISKWILRPLHLTSTVFDPSENSLLDRLAVGYLDVANQTPIVAPNLHASVTYSSGAMLSTVQDMYKWDRAIRGRQLVSPESWEILLTPGMGNYACGWWVDEIDIGGLARRNEWHWGVCYGFHGMITRLVDDDIVIIILQNVISPDLEVPEYPKALFRLRDRVLAELFDSPIQT